ncbi:MAG: hypothetical protein EXR10_05405 [Alphaproteobacteria bacterium]|nr:hypothetical protein [Alphaproteobacteria bacterium]PHY00722.1 MAG: hypothetical protein CK529_04350 [Rhodospirillaceae bacterium]
MRGPCHVPTPHQAPTPHIDPRCIGSRSIAQLFGGSHAQRDILSLTALHAAFRGGISEAAQATAFERTQHKPTSPWARRLSRHAAQLSAHQREA